MATHGMEAAGCPLGCIQLRKRLGTQLKCHFLILLMLE
jgi:hypothetical protein